MVRKERRRAKQFRNVLVFVAFLFGLYALLVLNECSMDEIPGLAEQQGVKVPLEDVSAVVVLERMVLELYSGETKIKDYEIAFGKGPMAALQKDSTPVGEFRILARHKRKDVLRRGSRFLEFDYPTEELAQLAWEQGTIDTADLRRIEDAFAAGQPPPHDTPLGGPIGIQGNYWFFLGTRNTDGSVALANGDVNELFEYLPDGTPITIKRNDDP